MFFRPPIHDLLCSFLCSSVPIVGMVFGKGRRSGTGSGTVVVDGGRGRWCGRMLGEGGRGKLDGKVVQEVSRGV